MAQLTWTLRSLNLRCWMSSKSCWNGECSTGKGALIFRRSSTCLSFTPLLSSSTKVFQANTLQKCMHGHHINLRYTHEFFLPMSPSYRLSCGQTSFTIAPSPVSNSTPHTVHCSRIDTYGSHITQLQTEKSVPTQFDTPLVSGSMTNFCRVW